jgi:inhibitor of KinA
MEITPIGDSAVIVHVREDFGDAPARAVSELLQVMRRIEAAQIPGIIELAPAYTTVAVYFDPCAIITHGADPDHVMDWVSHRLLHVLQKKGNRRAYAKTRLVDVPVCFDGEFALDLERVAHQANLSAEDVASQYCAAAYQVCCIGFTPGFPHLLGLPQKLTTPRRDIPRTEVPAGSVAIGGRQTGIYPLPSPGGWNVIGRTPLRLFDPQKNPPPRLRTGDRVRFRPIGRAEYDDLINSCN